MGSIFVLYIQPTIPIIYIYMLYVTYDLKLPDIYSYMDFWLDNVLQPMKTIKG